MAVARSDEGSSNVAGNVTRRRLMRKPMEVAAGNSGPAPAPAGRRRNRAVARRRVVAWVARSQACSPFAPEVGAGVGARRREGQSERETASQAPSTRRGG